MTLLLPLMQTSCLLLLLLHKKSFVSLVVGSELTIELERGRFLSISISKLAELSSTWLHSAQLNNNGVASSFNLCSQ